MRNWCTEDTELPACSVETTGQLVAVGTYKLCGDNSRQGRILLYSLHTEEGGGVQCRQLDSQDCAGVLDLKWSRHTRPSLAAAESCGRVSLYSLTEDRTGLLRTCELIVSSGLCLAVEWSADNSLLAVTDSEGALSILSAGQSDGLSLLSRISAHTFEAWTACFSKYNSNLVYSGGDDCVLKFHDRREGETGRSNRRSHSMGVTSMLCDSQDEHRLWTGSYDEQLRVWDVRNCRQEVERLAVGGGLWRIKQSSTSPNQLLLATMHDGFKIIRDLSVIAEYREHNSLAYGADWVSGLVWQGKALNIAATCSFYDHLFRVWSVS